MSFLSDLGSFLGDAQSVRDEFTSITNGLVSDVTDSVLSANESVQQVTSELQSQAESITQSTHDTVDTIRSDVQQ